jgi:aspartate kinase
MSAGLSTAPSLRLPGGVVKAWILQRPRGMGIIVQKYGGSSVADVARIRRVAERVQARRAEGHRLVVVVSAMGDTTDELLTLAKQVSVDPPRRELDMLLTCGERISMALLSMALQELDVPAISFTGSQSGIITDESHAAARIVEVRPIRILEELDRGKVVIVAGYQGVSRQREVTTLGRGGSDTTAVALAAALSAEVCEIYSDVEGVFSADPRLVPEARKLTSLSYDEMQELASAGARVLNAQAVEWAKAQGIVLHALHAHASGTGTRVPGTGVRLRSRLNTTGHSLVTAVASDADLLVLASRTDVLGKLLAFLAEREVRTRFVLGSQLVGEGSEALLAVPLTDVHGPEALRAELESAFGPAVRAVSGLGTVTLVGTGVGNEPRLLERALATAAARGVQVHAVHTGPLHVTLLVRSAELRELTRALHRLSEGNG